MEFQTELHESIIHLCKYLKIHYSNIDLNNWYKVSFNFKKVDDENLQITMPTCFLIGENNE